MNVVRFRGAKLRLADALSDVGIWWLEPGTCPARIYAGQGPGGVQIGGYWELDFSWRDRSIGFALAVHFMEPKRASSYWADAAASNRALLNIANCEGWRIIQPLTTRKDWIPKTVALVAD